MIPPAILFEDKRFLVIDKPAGLPVHPGRTGGISVETHFAAWRRGKQGPWLAHRLDQDTAGCLLVALKKSALVAAQAAFAGGQVEKIYWAVVSGVPQEPGGVIDLPLAKHTEGRSWRMRGDPRGTPAQTGWRVMGRGTRMAWVEFYPQTGRTHQIRAHAAALGHPVVGDAVYGGGAGALQLLARGIRLNLVPPVAAVAAVPDHMRMAMAGCGYAQE